MKEKYQSIGKRFAVALIACFAATFWGGPALAEFCYKKDIVGSWQKMSDKSNWYFGSDGSITCSGSCSYWGSIGFGGEDMGRPVGWVLSGFRIYVSFSRTGEENFHCSISAGKSVLSLGNFGAFRRGGGFSGTTPQYPSQGGSFGGGQPSPPKTKVTAQPGPTARLPATKPLLGVRYHHLAKSAFLPTLVEMGLPVLDGVFVDEVLTGSPAEKAGLRSYDVIISAGGAAIKKLDDLKDAWQRARPGSTLPLDVYRANDRRRLNLNVVVPSR